MVFSELLEKFNYNLYIFYINSLYKLCSVLYPIIKDIKFILSSYDKNKNKTKYIDYNDYVNLTAKNNKIHIVSLNDNIWLLFIFKLKNSIHQAYMYTLYYLSNLFYPIIKDVGYVLLLLNDELEEKNDNFIFNFYSPPKYDFPTTNNNLIDFYKYKALKCMYDIYIYFLYKIIILFYPLIRDTIIVLSTRSEFSLYSDNKNNIKNLDYLNLEFRVTKKCKTY